MTSMCVLGMRPVSLLTDQDLADWGNDSIEVLISHFGVEQVHTYKDDQQVVQKVKAGSVINPQQTRNEWMSLKKVVKAHGYPRRSTAEFWGIVKQYHGEDYPNLLHLAALALTHPVHTSDCERAFSAQNMVTTPLRNRLSSEHCDQLMRIMIQGSDLKNFNFLPVLKDWKESKCRSLFTGHK
ncbi:zinc finger protein 862-like [Ptychodera flava]|uniref:zinc finger protein 862-like n=1 Tax=Ptychodera flava TaxID=63121 RepID=UPI00396A1E8D